MTDKYLLIEDPADSFDAEAWRAHIAWLEEHRDEIADFDVHIAYARDAIAILENPHLPPAPKRDLSRLRSFLD